MRAAAPAGWPTMVIAPVPAVDPVVGDLRARHDPSSAFAVPAHITLLGPFLPAGAVDAAALARLRELLAGQPPVAVAFRAVRRFEPATLYLAPDPAEPFARLTRRLWEAWPQYPPYGGVHAEVIPHLTVGQGMAKGDLDAVEAALAACLPLETVVDQAVLLAYDRDALEASSEGRPGAPSPAEPLARLPFAG